MPSACCPQRFQQNMQRDSAWMMSIPVNSLLHSFRTQAGVLQQSRGRLYDHARLGGWESLDCDLRGHINRPPALGLWPRYMRRPALPL
jgi:hypothetical protein